MLNQADASKTRNVAVIVTHAVESYETWKRAFDGHATARSSAGIVLTHVNRSVDDSNLVSVYVAASDAEKLEAFLSSPDLKATMKNAGIKGPPQLAKIRPLEDRTVKDRPLPGAIVRHEVADFATWKRAFDDHAEARARAGIVGYAVNVSAERPNMVVVYLQAESLGELRAFTSMPELKEVMKVAGVMGAPVISFVNGGEWEVYR
jgi:hypothetical protein